MLNVFIGAANVPDIKAAPAVLVPVLEACDRVQKILADQGYRGKLAESIDFAYRAPRKIKMTVDYGMISAIIS